MPLYTCACIQATSCNAILSNKLPYSIIGHNGMIATKVSVLYVPRKSLTEKRGFIPMCLTIATEPTNHKSSDEFKIGTWFTDTEGQIFVLVRDDRNDEHRILCAGPYYHPFILNIPIGNFLDSRTLEKGTLLKIIKPFVEEGINENR